MEQAKKPQETGPLLLKTYHTIGKIHSKKNVLPLTPGEGRYYFLKPFPKKGGRLRSWGNMIKNIIPIMKIRFFN